MEVLASNNDFSEEQLANEHNSNQFNSDDVDGDQGTQHHSKVSNL